MQNSKILPRPGVGELEPQHVEQTLLIGGPELTQWPHCSACSGTGKVRGLLQTLECHQCYGTGADLRYAVSVIQLQKRQLDKARKVYVELNRRLQAAGATAEEQAVASALAVGQFNNSVEQFYKDSKYNKFD